MEKQSLIKRAERLQHIIDSYSRRRRVYSISNDKADTLRFGIVSDTHIGNLQERTDGLEEFYKQLKHDKIETVFHCGDILDGNKIYRGQEYDQYAYGLEAQLDALNERYPKIDGIKTYFITGNHDASYKRNSGIEVGKLIENMRKDMVFLDQDMATVIMKTKSNIKAKYQLVHPDGGCAYAVSYRSQKIIESYSGGEKPRAVFIGHYHKADLMPMWRNVRGIQAGCFCSQTSYMLRKATPAHVGGWIIEDTLSKNGTGKFKSEFISFYEPKEFKEI